jgi:hypothetical protein
LIPQLKNPFYSSNEFPVISINGKRFYVIGGEYYPSVTTILSSTADKAFLENWKSRIGEEAAKEAIEFASSRGIEFHTMMESLLQNFELKFGNLVNRFRAINVLKEISPFLDGVYCTEQAVYSKELKVAGRFDVLANWKGVPAIIDFKRIKRKAKKEWITDYFLQESAYAICCREMTSLKIETIVTILSNDDNVTEPQIFEEKVETWYDKLIKRITEYVKMQQ